MKPPFFKHFVLALAVSSLPLTVYAGSVTSTVNFVQVNASTDRAYIQFNTAATSRPACATDPRMTISLTTSAGKALYNMILTAKASGKSLFAAGTGTCTSKYENISYMRLL